MTEMTELEALEERSLADITAAADLDPIMFNCICSGTSNSA